MLTVSFLKGLVCWFWQLLFFSAEKWDAVFIGVFLGEKLLEKGGYYFKFR